MRHAATNPPRVSPWVAAVVAASLGMRLAGMSLTEIAGTWLVLGGLAAVVWAMDREETR